MKLRMRYMIPFHLEHRLIKKFGFAVESRKFNDCITFVKHKAAVKKETTVYKPSGLTRFKELELERRCDVIIDHFPDPYNAVMAVRQRLHNMSQALVNEERQYVLDWMEDNFPEELVNGKKKAKA